MERQFKEYILSVPGSSVSHSEVFLEAVASLVKGMSVKQSVSHTLENI